MEYEVGQIAYTTDTIAAAVVQTEQVVGQIEYEARNIEYSTVTIAVAVGQIEYRTDQIAVADQIEYEVGPIEDVLKNTALDDG